MNKASCFAVLAAIALPATALADCAYPKALGKLPDGTSATREDMVAGKKAVDAYNAAMNTYLDCLKTEHDAALAKADPAPTDEQKKMLTTRWTKQNDAAVDELQDAADRFNEQLRVFKARTAK